MNDQDNLSKGLLILKCLKEPTQVQHDRFNELLKPLASSLELKSMVLGPDLDVSIRYDNTGLIESISLMAQAMREQTQSFNALSEAIQNLAASNQEIVDSLVAGEDDPADPDTQSHYMDGEKI